MNYLKQTLLLLISLVIFACSLNAAPKKVTVLPFTNETGEIERNIVAYDLQEAIFAEIEAIADDSIELVPLEEVELELSMLNLDPSNPQYESDLWKAVNNLGIKKVVLGSYNQDNGKYLVNAYVYDSRMKLPHPRYQSKDNFIAEDKAVDLAKPIVNDLKLAIVKKK